MHNISLDFGDVDPLDPNSGSSNGTADAALSPESGFSEDIHAAGGEARIPPSAKKERREPIQQFWAFRFTFEKVDPKLLSDWLDEHAVAYGYQVEKGEKGGQLHYQGTFDLGRDGRQRETPLRVALNDVFPKLEFPMKDYCARSKSTAANRYGMKGATRVDGPWYKGVEFDEIAKETVYKVDITLRPWQLRIKSEVLDVEADDRKIWWFWEPFGGLGKTTFQKWIYQNYPNTIVLGGKSADMKNGIIQLLEIQKKNGKEPKLPDIIIMNMPKTFNVDYFSAPGTEEVKDMFFYSGKYEGGMVDGKPPKILIFANEMPPNVASMAKDRWVIRRLPDGPGCERELDYAEWSE